MQLVDSKCPFHHDQNLVSKGRHRAKSAWAPHPYTGKPMLWSRNMRGMWCSASHMSAASPTEHAFSHTEVSPLSVGVKRTFRYIRATMQLFLPFVLGLVGVVAAQDPAAVIQDPAVVAAPNPVAVLDPEPSTSTETLAQRCVTVSGPSSRRVLETRTRTPALTTTVCC